MAMETDLMLGNALELLRNVGVFVSVILVGILLGYLVGYLVAVIFKRIMGIRELKEQIAGSEIISLAFWGKLTSAVGVYIKWLFVAIGLRVVVGWAAKSALGNRGMFEVLVEYAQGFQDLIVNIGVFIVFTVAGIVVGAVVYRIIKAALDGMRVEEKLVKHGLHDALGGLQLTKVVAGIFMIYIILVLIGSGIDAVALRSGQEFNEVRLVVMFRSLIELYPEFVLGGFIIIAGSLVGGLMRDRIRKSKTALASENVGWLVHSLVLFFAIVLALPHFQIKENVDVLTDSFKIVVAGASIGLAIAMGLGLKETFGRWGRKVEKRL